MARPIKGKPSKQGDHPKRPCWPRPSFKDRRTVSLARLSPLLIFPLDDAHEREKTLEFLVAHQLPPCSYGSSKETGMTRRYFPECTYVEVPRVTFLLAMSLVDSFFRGERHVSSPNWLCRFICPGQFPINRGIPPLPSTFLRFSFFDIPRLEPCLGISSHP